VKEAKSMTCRKKNNNKPFKVKNKCGKELAVKVLM